MTTARGDVYGITPLVNTTYTVQTGVADAETDFARGTQSTDASASAIAGKDIAEILAERVKLLEQRVGRDVVTGPTAVSAGPATSGAGPATSGASGESDSFTSFTSAPAPAPVSYTSAPALAPALAPAPVSYASAPALSFPSMESYQTDEAMRRARLTEVIGTSDASEVLGKARTIDNKISAIEEIKDLIELFEKDGEKVDDIHIPTVDESDEIIFNTLSILRKHNDRRRFGSLADDCIMLAATSLEALCDGKREWLGFTPDLTGWSNHVRAKLRRMRHDTSQIASVVMNDYNIGPGLRLIIELLPNMIMYARGRASAHDSAVSDDQHGDAIDKLRAL